MSRAVLILRGPSDREKAAKNCEHCQCIFLRDPRNTWAYWKKARFCSRACAGASRSTVARRSTRTIGDVFEAYVIRRDGCWGWGGGVDKDGYGVFMFRGKQYRAPSVSLGLDGRPVPRGMYACHHCDVPACARPDHLYVGSPAQNAADAKSRGRLRPGRKAKLTPDQVIEIRSASGNHRVIAEQYGVSRAAISLIRERKTWRDVR